MSFFHSADEETLAAVAVGALYAMGGWCRGGEGGVPVGYRGMLGLWNLVVGGGGALSGVEEIAIMSVF